ncbi:MAG TPA: hypothetical protein VFP18_01910, partial [Candidatus Binatia bacterium]|nr:hypothetical protein [Candidatus Binatia bacterium]
YSSPTDSSHWMSRAINVSRLSHTGRLDMFGVKVSRGENHGPYLMIVGSGILSKASVRKIFRIIDETKRQE